MRIVPEMIRMGLEGWPPIKSDTVISGFEDMELAGVTDGGK